MSTTRGSAGWKPKGAKQVLLAVGLVLVVAASIAYILNYQSKQPRPLPESAYEQMYKAMYGGKASATAPRTGEQSK